MEIIDLDYTRFQQYFELKDIDFYGKDDERWRLEGRPSRRSPFDGEYWYKMNTGSATAYLVMEEGIMPDDVFILSTMLGFHDQITMIGKLKDGELRDMVRKSIAEYWAKIGEGLT